MALEVVKLTGCKYTGITLSEEQLKFAQQRVKKAGLEVLNPYLAYKENFMQTILYMSLKITIETLLFRTISHLNSVITELCLDITSMTGSFLGKPLPCLAHVIHN